jgi:hypothetical protein
MMVAAADDPGGHLFFKGFPDRLRQTDGSIFL